MGWKCPDCGYKNIERKRHCAKCGYIKETRFLPDSYKGKHMRSSGSVDEEELEE